MWEQASCLLALLGLPGIYFSILSSFCAFWLRCWLFFFLAISYIAYNFVFVVGLIIPEWMFVSLNVFSCGYFKFIEFFFELSALTPCFPYASLEIYHLSSLSLIHLEECVVVWAFFFFFFGFCVCVYCILVSNKFSSFLLAWMSYFTFTLER